MHIYTETHHSKVSTKAPLHRNTTTILACINTAR